MILEIIIEANYRVIMWIIELLPAMDYSAITGGAQTFIKIREIINFFVGIPLGNLVVMLTFNGLIILVIFAIVKLVRWLLPIV